MSSRSLESQRYDVTFYTPWLGPLLVQDGRVLPTGGAETQIFLVARALAARGVRVCLIVFDIEGVSIPSTVDGVDILVRPSYRARQRFVGKLIEARNIRRSLASVDTAVVVTRAAGPHVGLVALLTRLSGRRFVYCSANVSDFNSVLAPNLRDRFLFRLGIRLAHEVVVQTEEQVSMCREAFRRSSRLIRSIAEPSPARRAAPEAFLWIGRMVWYKRPLEFVELASAVPEARFWLVGVPVPNTPGGAELLEKVDRAAAKLPNLQLLEPRPREELLRLMERSVAVVNTADFEGLPNILLEGWALGVPGLVLSHDPDGVVVREGLGSFAAGDAAAFAVAARRMWIERHDQAAVAERCRRYVSRQHGASAVAAQWADVLAVRETATSSRLLTEAR